MKLAFIYGKSQRKWAELPATPLCGLLLLSSLVAIGAFEKFDLTGFKL